MRYRREVAEELSRLAMWISGEFLSQSDGIQDFVSGIASTPEGLSATEGAVIRERRRLVGTLQQLAVDEAVNETAMHRAIGARYWDVWWRICRSC